MSPSKYGNAQNRIENIPSSPTKKRYCYDEEQELVNKNNPENYQFQMQRSNTNGYYVSPTKRSTPDNYVPIY